MPGTPVTVMLLPPMEPSMGMSRDGLKESL